MGLFIWLYLFLIFILQLQFAYCYHPTQPFSYSPPPHNHPICRYEQSLALLQFKQNFNIDDVASSGCYDFNNDQSFSRPKTKSWNRTTDCCKWEGVKCDALTGQVIGLDLSCSQLYGTILSNSTLFKLSHLKSLNLAFNDFSSSRISHQFGLFSSLTHLNLSKSNFAGHVPLEIQHLSNLVSLDLSSSYLFSDKLEISNFEMLLQNLTQLRQLYLSWVNISSATFPVNLSSSLTLLDLSETGLHGNLLDEVLHLPNLEMLKLSGNRDLTVYLPKAANMSNSSPLRWLDLSSCNFSGGPILDFFFKLRHLSHLDLKYSNLNGPIPSSIGNLTQLLYLDLSSNSLTDTIPSSIGNLTQLVNLDISFNSLTGPIPSSIGNLAQLVNLDISSNSLTGPIPSSIGNQAQLVNLYISSNSLTGPIPSSIENLAQLSNLDLSSNLLTGPIPSSIGNITQLGNLKLWSNSLRGPIPSSIGNLTKLVNLVLSSNSLTGPIPSSISHLTQLTHLSLSSNSLTCPIPHSITKLKALEILELSRNNLTGTVELSMFSNHPGLSTLDLSYNNLYVRTTNTDTNATLPSLNILRLSSCEVKEFQDLLRSNKYINILDLRQNILQGPLPSTICDLTSLQVLDLSHNNLSGEILPCLGNFSFRLNVLNLEANNFHGTIPTTFAEGNMLGNLNFNGNQLEGKLPRSLANCKQLEVLDLGNNHLNDTFPVWLGTLPELKVLVFKYNRLHGSIPNIAHIESPFSKLRIIDLSNNEFSGRLPSEYFRYFKAMMEVQGYSTKPEYMSKQATLDFFRPNMSNRNISNEFMRNAHRYYMYMRRAFRYNTYMRVYMIIKYRGPLRQQQIASESSSYYEYSVKVVLKGMERELEKILTAFTTIDMSNNKFEGEIPNCIGNLRSLRGLNLSHNKLVGPIPPSLGRLSVLESLDLSSNQLEGNIPQQLTDLTPLAFLNLSQNHLVGCIPKGKQFNTFENDSYSGNSELRGFPLSKDCGGDETPHQYSPTNLQQDNDSDNESGFTWKAVCLGYGCGTLFGLVMGYLMFLIGKPKRLTGFVEKFQYKNGMKRGRQRRTRRRN